MRDRNKKKRVRRKLSSFKGGELMTEKKKKGEKKSHSLPLHFLSRTNKENHMQSTI
jgi:hypothetical protein